MAPRLLGEMCRDAIVNNIQQFDSFGPLHQELFKDLLGAVKSGNQLHELEVNSSEEIYLETPQHWRRIIRKDFPKLSDEYGWVPSDPKSWYKVWLKYKKVQEDAVAEATQILAQKLAAEKKEIDSKRTSIVTVGQARRLDLPKLGVGVLRSSSFGLGSAHWSAQPRSKATPLSKVRSQVKFEASRRQIGAQPGRPGLGQVARAPASFIRDSRVKKQFDPAATLVPDAVRPAPRTAFDVAERAREKERKEREARLLRIKGVGKPAETVLSFDDDDDDEEDTKESDRGVLDDLFGDLEANATSPASASPPAFAPNSRRRGLLSAAPGTTSITKVTRPATFPPAASTPSPAHSPPLSKSPPGSESPLQSPSPATAPPAMRPPKRKVVDIFLRPQKRVRR